MTCSLFEGDYNDDDDEEGVKGQPSAGLACDPGQTRRDLNRNPRSRLAITRPTPYLLSCRSPVDQSSCKLLSAKCLQKESKQVYELDKKRISCSCDVSE
jgi:hypothetical protein